MENEWFTMIMQALTANILSVQQFMVKNKMAVVLYTSRQDPKHSTFFCLFTKIKLKVKGK
jgi:hypothetical protein